MARFNEILVGRYNRFLQRFLSMKGPPPSPQLATEISTQFELDSTDNLENRFTAGFRSYATGLISPAVAAVLSAARISNPAGSNVVVIVEKIGVIQAGAAATALLLTRGPVGAGSFAGPLSGATRDIRQQTGSAAQVSTGSAAASTGATVWIGAANQSNTLLDVILDGHQEFVVMPGDVLTVWGTIVNTQLDAIFFWRERALEEGELV